MNKVNRRIGVYGANGRLNKKFLLSTKKALENIAGLADELQQQFPLGADKAINGVSRVAGYLHTLYHQVTPFFGKPTTCADICSASCSQQGLYFFASSKSALKPPTP